MTYTTIFLGGTVGENPWRKTLVIPGLLAKGIPASAVFDPVVSNWDKPAQEQEDRIKQDPECLLLYVLASPAPTTISPLVSGYSLVEAVMSLYDAPQRTVVVFDITQMTGKTARAMQKSAQDLIGRFPQAPIFTAYEPAIDWLAARFL